MSTESKDIEVEALRRFLEEAQADRYELITENAELRRQVRACQWHIAATLDKYSDVTLCQTARAAKMEPIDRRNRHLHMLIVQHDWPAETLADWERIKRKAENLSPYITLHPTATQERPSYLSARALCKSFRHWLRS